MISELKKAIEKADKLSAKEQKVMAPLILDEISWEQTFENSQRQLSTLGQEALEDYKKGRTKPLQF